MYALDVGADLRNRFILVTPPRAVGAAFFAAEESVEKPATEPYPPSVNLAATLLKPPIVSRNDEHSSSACR